MFIDIKNYTILLFSGNLSKICWTKLDLLQDIRKFYGELLIVDVLVFLNSKRYCQSVAFNPLATHCLFKSLPPPLQRTLKKITFRNIFIPGEIMLKPNTKYFCRIHKVGQPLILNSIGWGTSGLKHIWWEWYFAGFKLRLLFSVHWLNELRITCSWLESGCARFSAIVRSSTYLQQLIWQELHHY